MALIRSLSNPEGLYIYGDMEGDYDISTGHNWKLCNIGAENNHISMVVPGPTFEKAARKWLAGYGESVCVDGFEIETNIHIYKDTQDAVPDFSLETMLEILKRETFWGLKLSYKDKYTYLYEVTLHYALRRFQ